MLTLRSGLTQATHEVTAYAECLPCSHFRFGCTWRYFVQPFRGPAQKSIRNIPGPTKINIQTGICYANLVAHSCGNGKWLEFSLIKTLLSYKVGPCLCSLTNTPQPVVRSIDSRHTAKTSAYGSGIVQSGSASIPENAKYPSRIIAKSTIAIRA